MTDHHWTSIATIAPNGLVLGRQMTGQTERNKAVDYRAMALRHEELVSYCSKERRGAPR